MQARRRAPRARTPPGRHPGALVLRTSACFGPWDAHNFVTGTLRALREGRPCATSDVVVSPTYLPDLVSAALDLLVDGATGIWHVATPGVVSWLELGRAVAARGGHDAAQVRRATVEELGWRARRPTQSALTSTRGVLLPPLGDALDRSFGAAQIAAPELAGRGAGQRVDEVDPARVRDLNRSSPRPANQWWPSASRRT